MLSPLEPQKPRSAHIRAVSNQVSIASRAGSPVAGRVDVLAQRIGDVGVDVVLRGTGRVVGRRLLAVDRAPREQGAVLLKLLGPPLAAAASSSGTARRCGPVRRGVREERQDVDLGVPEVVAPVTGAA